MPKLVAIAATAALAGACGFEIVGGRDDAAVLPADDAPPAPTLPVVQVTTPNGGETLYPATPFLVTWTSDDDAATYDVALIDASGGTTGIASSVTATSTLWTPSGVATPTTFRVRVTATNAAGSASDESDASFTLAPPETGTSFARDVQPIFNASCLTQFCHSAQHQVAQLDLAAGAAYGDLVDVPSIENPCTSYLRVRPGMPDQSYLVFKLQGGGPCFFGVRMPKSAPALPAAQINTVRAWIAEGALDN